MLRIYIAQRRFGLSGEGIEDAIYDSQANRAFIGLGMNLKTAPDSTRLLKVCRLLETNNPTERIFTAVNSLLAARGLLLKEGAVVDATIIEAPSFDKKQRRSARPGDVSNQGG
jgi:transposase, IS5 family